MYKRIYLDGMFKCNYCLKTCSSQSKLKRHQQLHTGTYHFDYTHKNEIELKKLLTIKNVRKYVYSREKQFNCFLRCKQLRTSDDKNDHLKTHCGVKFKPQESVEKILQENNLSPIVQMQSFGNIENRFSCNKCLKTY